MIAKDFVKSTVTNLNPSVLVEMKKLLLGDFISFSILNAESVNEGEFAEKICDYFEKLELRTGRTFDKYIEIYMKELDSVVEPHIAKAPQSKNGDNSPVIVPRARKYYEKSVQMKDLKTPSISNILDYSRIMMCLYAAIKESNDKPINNFNYSSDCIKPEAIMDALKNEEEASILSKSKKKKFDMKDIYSADACTLLLSTIVLCSIANRREGGDAV